MMDQWVAPVDLVGWTLLHFLWQGTLAALGLAFVLLLVPRHWGRLRYVSACATLALMSLAPVITIAALQSGHLSPIALTAASEPHANVAPGVGSATGTSDSAALPVSRAIASPAVWLPWFVAAWALGVVICATRLAGGWWHARRLLREGVAEPAPEWTETVVRIAARMGMHEPVRLLESARAQVPLVIGSFRPVLLLPASALTGLSPAQVEAVIAHELAHIRRCDYLVNLLQSAVETVLFYHPAVWWVSHTIRVEREHCCDDLAVEACGDVLLYAKALTTLETLRGDHVGVAMAASTGSLLSRVRRLMGHRSPAPVASSGWVVAAATALMVAGAGASGWLQNPARWVSFAPPSEAVAMAAVAPDGMTRWGDDAVGGAAPESAPQPQNAPEPAQPVEQSEPQASVAGDEAGTRAPSAFEQAIEGTVEAAMQGLEAMLAQAFEDPEFEALIAQAVEATVREAERGLREAGPELAELTRDTVREALREAERTVRELRAELRKDVRKEIERERKAAPRAPRASHDAAALAQARREARRANEVQRRTRALAADAARLSAEAGRIQAAVKDALPPERLREIQELARQLSEHARAFAAEARRSHQLQQARPAPVPRVAPAPSAPDVVPAPPVPPAPVTPPERPRLDAPAPPAPPAPPPPDGGTP